MGTAVAPSGQGVQVPSSPQEADSTPKEPTHLRLDVQGLRAVAVLLVVAFHAGLPVPGGFIGVDVFLVISGFVITGMLLREIEKTGTIRLRNFYTRRVKRLLPALALLTTVVMLLSYFYGSFATQETTAKTGLGATYLVANNVIYRDSVQYFSPEAETNPLLHTWTLSVEEQTYLVFPSLLLGAWIVARLLARRASPIRDDGNPRIVGRRSLRASRFGVGTMLVLIGVASYVLCFEVSTHHTATPAAWAFYSSIARVWEFAIGAGLALSAAKLRRINPTLALLLGVAGAAAILVGAFTLSGDMPYPGTAALLPVLGAAAIIAAGFASTSGVSRSLSTTPMVTIGDMSYSLYLWHWPLIVFAAAIWPGRAWLLVAAAVVSFLPAAASYGRLERPIRADPRIKGKRVLALIAVCVLVPTVAGLVLLVGARNSWGNEDVQQMQEQLDAVHEGQECDEGATGEQDVEGTVCEINPGSTNQSVTLIGNSIAAMYSDALAGSAEALDLPLRLDTHSGGFCEALDALGCEDVFAEAYDRLLNGSPPNIVVISGTWDLGAFGGAELDEKTSRLTEDLAATIRALHEAGHHVLIVLPLPRFFYGEEEGTFVPTPLASGDREPHATVWRPDECPAEVAQNDPTACGATLIESEVDESQAVTIEVLRQLAEDTGASTLFLRDRYCNDGDCATNDGNVWMFRDGLHISVGESEALVPTFTRVLQDIIERRSAEGQFQPGEYVYLDSDIAA